MSDNTYTLLHTINSPDDLKKISEKQLPVLCQELRQFIIEELSQNPGHLGASLGSVEITVALHYIFKTPYDRIIWDVGHQAYGHKILTGRRDKFHTNRKYKGLSGFPNPKESEYDAFIAGHASNSISAALGVSIASHLQKDDDRQVIAVIGDGAMTGGLAFEGLNNTSIHPNNLLIILNDNQMAIDPIYGGISQYLVDITTSRTYNKVRFKVFKFLHKLGWVNEKRKRNIITLNNSIKAALSQQHNIFEGLNIRYFGPVDGHDVKSLVRILSEIKNFKGPKVLHCITKKGKGFEPAENFATEWHAPGKFDKNTGIRNDVDKTADSPPLFQDVFGKTLVELAKQNPKIVGITPAMPSGCSMSFMMKEMPDRSFDVGIAEGHAVTFSAGLAKEGLLPFCNVYSSFMQRAYDNIIHDVALQNLPFVLCLDRAGIVGADGATHHGVFDLAYLRCIPNMTIASPLNEIELRNLMYTAQLNPTGPFAIRYPRGKGVLSKWELPFDPIPIGKGVCLKEGKDIAIISLGPIGNSVAKAIELVEDKKLTIAHYDLRFLKPLDTDLLKEIGTKFKKVITIEDGCVNGGMGSAIIEFMSENGFTPELLRIGIPDRFVEHGSPEELYHELQMDEQGLMTQIQSFIKKTALFR
jgi:1-deoxy-D-xylulose-5-phosphate synthase